MGKFQLIMQVKLMFKFVYRQIKNNYQKDN